MPPSEVLGSIDESSLDAVIRLLQGSWPILVNLTPSRLGLDRHQEAHRAFVHTMRILTESGLMTCEAIVDDSADPEVIDAALTARGRALFEPMLRADGA